MTLVSIALSALGAGGVLLPGARKVRGMAAERKRRRDTRETPQEFYYRRQTVALRVVVPDHTYIHRREARIVSRVASLSRVPWGSRPLGDIVVVDERLSSSHPTIRPSLVEADPNVDRADGWKRRYVRFGQPLRRNQEIEFVHVESLMVVGKPLEHFLRWSPVTRCDHITLQVAFASHPPAVARYSAHSSTGEELECDTLELDVIMGAYTVAIDNPVPGRYYKISW
ncbi:hypothetical protein [Longimicrobium sp.]|uniref:hypothetical protein n=1 Tax=Longimicrobium sp. TaxID=2029185 RepID=UPI002D7F4FAA|nr:hypothetical protein [Longimicrobium sp.]